MPPPAVPPPCLRVGSVVVVRLGTHANRIGCVVDSGPGTASVVLADGASIVGANRHFRAASDAEATDWRENARAHRDRLINALQLHLIGGL